MVIIIINQTRDIVVTQAEEVADTFLKRLVGLLGRSSLPEQSGLIITPCNQIHSFFMKFPFDAVFLTRDNRVIYFIEDMKPFRASPLIKKAAAVLELPAGTIQLCGIEKHDQFIRKE